MALAAFTVLPPTTKFQIKLFNCKPSLLHGCLLLPSNRHVSPMCSMKTRMTQFGEPNKVKEQLGIVKETLWEAVPQSVKDFPLKKAEDMLLERLIFLGQKVFKWSLITLFIFSSLSDAIFSISTNQELMIPLGLLIGCLMANFLKEVSQEVFHRPEGKASSQHLLGISCFFVLVKFISICFGLQARVFLLLVANGGIMQVLWLWKSSLRENGGRGENFSAVKDASD